MAYYFSPFRNSYSGDKKKIEGQETCPFCSLENIERQCVRNTSGMMVENEHYRWMVNFFPKFEGHTMLIPKRHLKLLEEESPDELLSRHTIGIFAMKQLEKVYPECGFEIFLQCGAGSEQSVEHLHSIGILFQHKKATRFEVSKNSGSFIQKRREKRKSFSFPPPFNLLGKRYLKN